MSEGNISGAGFPWYFAIGDRLVKVEPTAAGGLDVRLLNPETGKLERNMTYLAQCFDPGQDVERLSEAVFNARVQAAIEQS